MVPNLPAYISVLFILTTFLTLYLFWRAGDWPKWLLWILLAWLGLQAVLGYSGLYIPSDAMPPKFLLLVIPALTLVILGAFIKPFDSRIGSLGLKALLLVHIVRIPVEIILFLLYKNGAIPQLTTFDGRNYDILAGLTAPLIYFFGFKGERPKRNLQIIWNVVCLGLLINIVSTAILSAPFPFQQFGFDQPNIAVFYFPFVWLPGLIVPCVLYSHLVSIRRLISG